MPDLTTVFSGLSDDEAYLALLSDTGPIGVATTKLQSSCSLGPQLFSVISGPFFKSSDEKAHIVKLRGVVRKPWF